MQKCKRIEKEDVVEKHKGTHILLSATFCNRFCPSEDLTYRLISVI